jgi:hypothetical protein
MDYPIYAIGPGYVISSDIADAILSEFLNHKLRVAQLIASGMHFITLIAAHMVAGFQQFACLRITGYLLDHISLQKFINKLPTDYPGTIAGPWVCKQIGRT